MGLWERMVWYCQGMNRYTRSGFDRAYKHFDTSALQLDLTGKVFIVTGANSGIGKVVARELGARGATVHMLCRNQAKGDAAATELATATGKPAAQHFVVHQVDLANPVQIKQFARGFAAKNSRLDCLINNAGCLNNERLLTADGLESSFACNVLGMYMLTECLMPVLSKTAGARVVAVTSAGMLTEQLEAGDPQSTTGTWDGKRAYSCHKRAQVELIHHWAITYPSLQFLSVHPGWVDTPGVAASMPSFYRDHRNKLRTPEQGADSVLWCAAATAAMSIPNGAFVEDRKVASEHLMWSGTATAPGDLERLINYLNGLSERFPVDGTGPGAKAAALSSSGAGGSGAAVSAQGGNGAAAPTLSNADPSEREKRSQIEQVKEQQNL